MSRGGDARVRAFYEALPFNHDARAEDAAARIRGNPLAAYPDLGEVLEAPGPADVLEIGCGAGWAANTLALHYRRRVTAVDFTAAALERAREVACLLGTEERIDFVQADLFDYAPPSPFPLVLSLGVLHHTHDCGAAFRRVAGFVAPGGHLFVGLYHGPGRAPFLALFREILAADGEVAAFRRFAGLRGAGHGEAHLRSWFRDQVLHPQESQHTLAEVWDWLDEAGLELRSTSINRYGSVADRSAVLAEEPGYADLSEQRNRHEGRFFPGFFTVLAQRR